MANLVRIDPSVFSDVEGWFVFDDGKSYLRPLDREVNASRSDFPCPMIRRDSIDACQSMADGKTYDSLSALRRTYRADGNPQGVEYLEIGNNPFPTHVAPEIDKKARRDDLRAAVADFRAGRIAPPTQTGIDV